MTLTDSAIGAIADLAEQGQEESRIRETLPTRDGSLAVQRIEQRDGLAVIDFERYLDIPRRQRGDTVVHDPDDFAEYVRRIAGQHTTIWCDQTTRVIRAVINDHAVATDNTADAAPMGWRDHTVTLNLQLDPYWAAWIKHDQKWLAQVGMAEHLEEFGGAVFEPTQAEMVGMAQTIRATKNAQFDASAVSQSTGDFAIGYQQETRASHGGAGNLEVPQWFKLRLAPYVGHEDDAVEIDARFRLNVDENSRLSLGYQLVRPDLVIREAFDKVRTKIADNVAGLPVLLGVAPDAVRAESSLEVHTG